MREVGMLVSRDGFPLNTVFGEPARVDFPIEYALDVHKRFPGLLNLMVHSHPRNMPYMSEEDRTTLLAWTYAFSPYPIYMEVICYVGKEFQRIRFWYEIESLKTWKSRKKKIPRKVKLHQMDLSGERPQWTRTLTYYSYNLNEKENSET